jgi:hypothetical protein
MAAGGYYQVKISILHYDNTPSPLTPQGGGTQSILGPGGLVNALDGIDHQLGQDPPNILGAGLTAYKSFKNFSGASLGAIAGAELTQLGKDVLRGSNPLSRIQIPSIGGLIGGGGSTAGIAATGAVLGASAVKSLFGGGGANSPSGATDKFADASTGSTKTLFAGAGATIADGASKSVAYVKSLFSNGEGVAGPGATTNNSIPTSPITVFDDGSKIQEDLKTGQITTTDADGLVTVKDKNGSILSQSNADGTVLATKDSNGDLSTSNAVPVYDQSQLYGGQNTTINNDSSQSGSTDQSSPTSPDFLGP